jgi:EAL domain-containing protein (putative c-di-GMP-specific phosphodiesterase class I)
MAQWHRDLPGSAHIGVSVNVSGKQFAQPEMVAEIESLLRETGLPSKCLSVEITESVLFVNVDAAISVLKMLSNMGVGLKIDHFGTGFSSLNYLHRLPVNELKIDRSFIEGMGRKESDNIVRTIVMLARALGLSVVADGVSTNDQLQKLALLGCDYAQGALFSEALDHTAARRLLELNLAAEPAPVAGPGAFAGSLL